MNGLVSRSRGSRRAPAPPRPSSGSSASSLIMAVTQSLERRGSRWTEQWCDPFRDPRMHRSSAAIAWRQNRAGSLSPASSDSHATGRSMVHSATRAVLPKPAGALIRMRPRANPSAERLQEAWTGYEGHAEWRGMNSLVASSPSDPRWRPLDGAGSGGSGIARPHAPQVRREGNGTRRHCTATAPATSPAARWIGRAAPLRADPHTQLSHGSDERLAAGGRWPGHRY